LCPAFLFQTRSPPGRKGRFFFHHAYFFTLLGFRGIVFFKKLSLAAHGFPNGGPPILQANVPFPVPPFSVFFFFFLGSLATPLCDPLLNEGRARDGDSLIFAFLSSWRFSPLCRFLFPYIRCFPACTLWRAPFDFTRLTPKAPLSFCWKRLFANLSFYHYRFHSRWFLADLLT